MSKLTSLALGVLIAILLGFGIGFNIQQKRINILKNENKDLIQVANDSGRIARTYLNKYGFEVSKNKLLQLSHRDFVKLKNSEETSFLKQIDDVKKNLKNVEQTIRIEMEAKFKIGGRSKDTLLVIKPTPNKPNGDSIRAKTYTYNDQYNDFLVMAANDTMGLYGTAIVPLDGVVLWERRNKWLWILSKRIYYSEFTTPNKFVKIKQQEILQIRKK